MTFLSATSSVETSLSNPDFRPEENEIRSLASHELNEILSWLSVPFLPHGQSHFLPFSHQGEQYYLDGMLVMHDPPFPAPWIQGCSSNVSSDIIQYCASHSNEMYMTFSHDWASFFLQKVPYTGSSAWNGQKLGAHFTFRMDFYTKNHFLSIRRKNLSLFPPVDDLTEKVVIFECCKFPLLVGEEADDVGCWHYCSFLHDNKFVMSTDDNSVIPASQLIQNGYVDHALAHSPAWFFKDNAWMHSVKLDSTCVIKNYIYSKSQLSFPDE